jgi:hypothetical protein
MVFGVRRYGAADQLDGAAEDQREAALGRIPISQPLQFDATVELTEQRR